MSGPCYRHLRPVIVLWLLTLATVPTSSAPGQPGPTPTRMLQLNLCNSGQAAATPASVAEAAELIRSESPHLVPQ